VPVAGGLDAGEGFLPADQPQLVGGVPGRTGDFTFEGAPLGD
jgi:hypothetical protein